MVNNSDARRDAPEAATGRPRSAAQRADRYRSQAAQMRRMAGSEPSGRLRDRLLDLARQYDSMAEALEAPPCRRGD